MEIYNAFQNPPGSLLICSCVFLMAGMLFKELVKTSDKNCCKAGFWGLAIVIFVIALCVIPVFEHVLTLQTSSEYRLQERVATFMNRHHKVPIAAFPWYDACGNLKPAVLQQYKDRGTISQSAYEAILNKSMIAVTVGE